MTYHTYNSEILALFTVAGKNIPAEDSDMGRAVQILQVICGSQSHTVPDVDGYDSEDEKESAFYNIFAALEEIENNIDTDDFRIDFDGNEYRLISESDIDQIYQDEIQSIVEDCYSDVLNLDAIPSFIAISIDWQQTAQNALVDGYGHTFSGYDGSEENIAGYYIFRTN